MNIGIDATCWQNQRGFGRFTRGLLNALFELETPHRFFLFVDQSPDESAAWPHVEYIQVSPQRPLTESATAGDRRRISDMVRLYKAVAVCPLDLMFFPAVYSWFPVPRRLLTMVTLHDAIPEHFPKMVFPDWKSRMFWNVKVKLALWQCDRVLTVSGAAKKEINQYTGVPLGLIDVTSEAPGPLFTQKDDPEPGRLFRQKYAIPPDAQLIVYVGGMAPHKNLHRFMDGLSLSLHQADLDDAHLLLVGDLAGAGFHTNYDSLRHRLDGDETLKGQVHFSGFVTDEQLVDIYNDAVAVTVPSLSEGFGLPAIEAMACGTPILASDRGSLPEVVGDAGLYFDPYDAGDIGRAITILCRDEPLRQQLGRTAKARAATFTWPNAARQTLGFLESMAE